jgi:hypothetical protein
VFKTHASYSGGPGFMSQPCDCLSWSRFLVVSSVPPGECQGTTLKFSHDHFLLNPFQFIIIHLSPYHRRYII